MALPSLRRNFSWALVGNLTYSAAQFFALVLLAKLGSAEIVGRYSLGLAVAAPIMLLANLKLRQVQATDQGNEYAYADYAGLRLVTAPLAAAVIALVAVGVPVYSGRTAAVIAGVGLAKAFEAVSDVAYGNYLRHERNDLMARSQIARGAGVLAAVGLGLLAFRSLLAVVLFQSVAWGVLAALDLRVSSGLEPDGATWRPRFDGPVLRRITWTALPLGIVVMMGALQNNVPRYAVEAFHGEAALGIFAGMAYLLVAQGTVIGAMGLAASPRLALHWSKGERPQFLSLLGRLVLGGFGLGLVSVTVAYVAGEPILWLLFNEEFAAESGVLVRLMIAAAITATFVFLGTGINAMRRFNLQVPVQAVGLVSVSVLTALWVPERGASGAADALIGAALATLVVYVAAMAWLLRQPVAASAPKR